MNKGFTLTELLAVIAILAIIAIITVPTIIEVLNTSKENLTERQKNLIVSAARNWGTTNLTVEGTTPSQSYVTIETLQNAGYLDDKEIKDLAKNEAIDKNYKVCITWKNNQFVYEYGGANC